MEIGRILEVLGVDFSVPAARHLAHQRRLPDLSRADECDDGKTCEPVFDGTAMPVSGSFDHDY